MSDEGIVNYRPARSMVVYHWALSLAFGACFMGVVIGATAEPWPVARDVWASACMLTVGVVGEALLVQRAWFVAFTRARAWAEGLIVSIPGVRGCSITWDDVEAAHTSSYSAFPIGRIRFVRIRARGRTISIPLSKHPRDDELFGAIVQRANLRSGDADWRADPDNTGWGRSDWVRSDRQGGPEALEATRRQALGRAWWIALFIIGLMTITAIRIAREFWWIGLASIAALIVGFLLDRRTKPK